MFCYSVLFLILVSCSSSIPTDESRTNSNMLVGSSEYALSLYEFIAGKDNTSIEKMTVNKVYINDEHSDSLLFFCGLKNDKLWLEGYHADYKDWVSDIYKIMNGEQTCNITKFFSWTDKEVISKEMKEFPYRYGTEIIIDTLSYVYPFKFFVSSNNNVCAFRLNYKDGHCVNLIKFVPSDLIVPEDVTKDFIEYIYKWGTNYIVAKRWHYQDESYIDCYSMDGQHQYSVNRVHFSLPNFIGISRECGISKSLPSKCNLLTDSIEWEITEQQIVDKLGLMLSGKDKIDVAFSSKQSDSIWIYKVKVLYEDLYKGDDTFEIKVDVEQGRLI